jgi:hypothetical protein
MRTTFLVIAASAMLITNGCDRSAHNPTPVVAQHSNVKVVVNPGGPAVLRTSTAEFQLLPSGYVQASLLKAGATKTLDDLDPAKAADSDYVVADGKEIHFALDLARAKVNEATGRMGRGKRVEIPARPSGPSDASLQKVLTIEVYDAEPGQ